MLIGYLLFALVNFVLVLTGLQSGFGIGGSGALGIGISLFATGLAAVNLAIDFDNISLAIRTQAPVNYGWTLALGLVITVVWLYLELLRLLGHVLTRWQRTGTGGQNPAVRRGDGRGTRAHEGGSRDEAGSLAAVESGGATA